MKPVSVSTKQERIAKLAKDNPEMALTSLNHYLDYDWLLQAYNLTRKDGATGVDGQTHAEYGVKLESNLLGLIDRIKSGKYRAPNIRSARIPKGDGSFRELGIPTLEDKIVQRAVVMLLEPIYEQDFHPFSFGFRRGKSTDQALQHLRSQIMGCRGCWVLDADIRKYFDTISHVALRTFLAKRVNDGVVRKLIDKWLKAGILEDGTIHYTTSGTPQGGVVSPLLSNIYLHYVLDEWFVTVVLPLMKGYSGLTRFCDDFVMVFECEEDCSRVFDVLHKRLGRFDLSLHPEKTRIVDFHPGNPTDNQDDDPLGNFTFLSFTHIWVKSRKGNTIVNQRTSKERFSRGLAAIKLYCRKSRHRPLSEQRSVLSSKMRGHFAYFGITGNGKSIKNFHHQVERIWHKWLSRRTRNGRIPWDRFSKFLERHPLPEPKIYHTYGGLH